ncbi:MAG: glycosyltransferase family 4 protein [Ectothiorhodospiraceae bacterium]|jgi:glycosyltransferase involved in cell wall biosynthesis|nr:glycosyltransferase family 4 protein [Ectothiorhodospiraceae bacterium]
MNIALLVSSMHMGGAERVAATLANAWAARGDRVTLVPTWVGRGECVYPLHEAVRLQFLADRMPGDERRPPSRLRRLWALRDLIREVRADVVVSFLPHVNLAAILATRGLGVPVIVCERTDPVGNAAHGKGLNLARRWLYPMADAVTMQSRAAAERFRAAASWLRRLEAIPNPLPDELLARPLADTALQSGRGRLMALGRLHEEKGHEALMDAFARLAADFPDWDLWIWGEGDSRGSLARRITGLGLDGRIHLPGSTSRPWDELARAQVFALSSPREGFPNALLEAMALGLPCISFDCPSGPREILRDGQDGLLVPVGDVAALAGGLRRLLMDPKLRCELGARAAASVRERYALARVLDEWDALFEAVRHERRRAR